MAATACGALLATTGCQNSPARVAAPSWDGADLAAAAIEQLDSNGDGTLDAEEWSAAPGLAAGADLIDVNGDELLSEEEIAARFNRYRRLAIGLCSRSFRFTYKGRPLADAKVVFVPEPFLGEVIKPAMATTNRQGIAYPQTKSKTLPGMQVGYYRIQVTSPHVALPAKYNEATQLGVEISGSNDDPSGYETTEFRLDR